jgi:DtxR family Mn-dependent transcriptional regulator
MQLSFTEENYLKAIFNLLKENEVDKITTNAIASVVDTAPASVTDMLRKLAVKKLVNYERYQGASLTSLGRKSAVNVIRKHRLWELFLAEKLGFTWDEVHEIAEQLEHINSELLVQRLYTFLGKPKFDPHGDPIPDEHGNFQTQKTKPLSTARLNEKLVICGVMNHQPEFLQYLAKNGLSIGKKIFIKEITAYDRSMALSLGNSGITRQLSIEVTKNILVSISR